jgi:hypothetical protein
MSFWANVFLGNCLLGKRLMGKYINVHLGKCLHGETLYGQMSTLKNVVWAYVYEQMSIRRCRMGKCLFADVVWANVIEPQKIYDAVWFCVHVTCARRGQISFRLHQ